LRGSKLTSPAKLLVKQWILLRVLKRRRDELLGMSVTEAANALVEESKSARDWPRQSREPLRLRTCRNVLSATNLWPKKPRRK
jgi:hypothetical protein